MEGGEVGGRCRGREHRYAELCLVAQPCPTLWESRDCILPGSAVHGGCPGKNTGVGSLSLLQGIFPTKELNQGPLNCRWILYQLIKEAKYLDKDTCPPVLYVTVCVR